MSFWDILLRRPCKRQWALNKEHNSLAKAVEEHKKATAAAVAQVARAEQTTAALEVSAKALAAVVRGRNGESK